MPSVRVFVHDDYVEKRSFIRHPRDMSKYQQSRVKAHIKLFTGITRKQAQDKVARARAELELLEAAHACLFGGLEWNPCLEPDDDEK